LSRILVTGAAGVVGGYIGEVFGDHDLILTDIVGEVKRLDVTEAEAVRSFVADAKPKIVVHLAAATDVDRCEQHPDFAFRTNAIGTQNVALACREEGAILVYTSTAAVFGGEKSEPYTEFDNPDPANVYGHSKLAGERIVQTLLDHRPIDRLRSAGRIVHLRQTYAAERIERACARARWPLAGWSARPIPRWTPVARVPCCGRPRVRWTWCSAA